MSTFINTVLFIFFLIGASEGLGLRMHSLLGLLPPNTSAIEKHNLFINISLQTIPPPSTQSFPVYRSMSTFFYAEVLIGTPPQKSYLALETTTSPTWVQSAQCTACFPSASPGFNPKQSTTFRPMLFIDPVCKLPYMHPLRFIYCSYTVDYITGHRSIGKYATDTLNFVSGQGQRVPIQRFGFGVGLNNYISFGNPPSPITGILGLGKGHPSSLLQQFPLTAGKFCYCLPVQMEQQMELLFGTEAEESLQGKPDVRTTPILPDGTDFYQVLMTGAYMGGSALAIKPQNVIINSGAPISTFNAEAYIILREAVVQYFDRKYGWPPLLHSRTGYNLCYQWRAGAFERPWLTLHLEHGADLHIAPDGLFRDFLESNEFCLIIMPGFKGTSNVLGAFQQANHRFLFDVNNYQLSFVGETC